MVVLTPEIADQLIAEQGLDVVIPDIYTSFGGGTFIGQGAFTGKGLTSVEIPESITFIPDYTFAGNELETVGLHSGSHSSAWRTCDGGVRELPDLAAIAPGEA